MLSDVKKKVSRDYGVLNIFPRLARRTTFVIDGEGIIRHVESGAGALSPRRTLEACQLPASR